MATEKQRVKTVEALMALAADKDFADIGLPEIADRAGVSLAQLRGAYDGKHAILEDFVRRIDAIVLDGQDASMSTEPLRERLFDVLMRRFDALTPSKPGLAGLMRSARRDPALAAVMNRLGVTSQRWMLAAAGVETPTAPFATLINLARAQALTIAYASALRVWLAEDEPGSPKTMVALDKVLKQLEQLAKGAGRVEKLLSPLFRRRSRAAGEPEPAHVTPDGATAH